jgi:hypothetical protein
MRGGAARSNLFRIAQAGEAPAVHTKLQPRSKDHEQQKQNSNGTGNGCANHRSAATPDESANHGEQNRERPSCECADYERNGHSNKSDEIPIPRSYPADEHPTERDYEENRPNIIRRLDSWQSHVRPRV